TASQAPKVTSAKGATVSVATTGLGKALVDSTGRTLYLFEKDSGTRSSCSGACADAWPPLRVSGSSSTGGGARASMIGTTKRNDGAAPVTYNGHPLYLYAGDQKPGDTNGQGLNAFGAEWYALSPAGDRISDQQSSPRGDGYGGY